MQYALTYFGFVQASQSADYRPSTTDSLSSILFPPSSVSPPLPLSLSPPLVITLVRRGDGRQDYGALGQEALGLRLGLRGRADEHLVDSLPIHIDHLKGVVVPHRRVAGVREAAEQHQQQAGERGEILPLLQ